MLDGMFVQDSSFPSTASTSQEDLENGSSSTSSRKLRVTLLSSEWKSTKGGLSTINRELAIQLAKHPNVEVSVYLPQCSEEDKRVAAKCNVHLIEAEEVPGYDPVDWLASVPKHHVMDCVIGHGLPLGRQVPHIKRHHNCNWIQVVHTAPEELAMYKSYADTISKGEKKHQAEVKLCKLADQVVAIGPKLAEAFSGYLRSCGKDQDVLNLTPGIFSEFADVKQATKERGTFSVLVFGRGDSEDFQLKGYDIAAQAISELKDMTYKLVFVGASSGGEEKVKEVLLQQGIDRSQLRVRCFKESREQLADLFCEMDLAVMPSRTEGFGLAALEALSAGLPVLVSGNSGLGEALKKVPYGSHCVLESEDPKEWAKAIRAVRQKDRELRLQESKVLCGEYAKKYSWEEQCVRLVERMVTITFENNADEQGLSLRAPLHSSSFHKGPAGIQASRKGKRLASGKGKRLLSASATPSPKRRLTDDREGPAGIQASGKGKRQASGKGKRQASGKGKRLLSPSATPAPKRRLTDDREAVEDNSVVVKLLKAEYDRRAQFTPLLWDSTRLPLEHVYTRLKIVSRRKADIKVRDDEVDVFDIFNALKKGDDVMMLVEGNPGIGKTTFCLKLAYDWANGKVPTEFSFPKFEFVLLLKCRDINGDIMETISEQLLPEDIKEKIKEKLIDFIRNIHNQEKILIILDGLDELPKKSEHHVDKLLSRRILPFCYVLVTCRQERGIEVRKKIGFDIHLDIKGFTETDAYEYVRKHFENVGPGHLSKGERLIGEIKENTFLHALRNNPLNLLLLCVIYEDYEGKLPTSRTELYQVIVQCLLRRFCAKRNLEAHEDNKALEEQFKEDILALGELAWKCLLNDRHCFRETELKGLERKNKKLVAREIGLLFKEESLKRTRPQNEYHFLHKTLQEYLAASYVAHKLRSNQLKLFEHLSFEDVVGKYRQVFLFVSGILDVETSILFTQIGEKLKSSGDWDWCKCSEEVANFFTESFSENGNDELMAATLCSFIPFPPRIEISDEDHDYCFFNQVLKACKSFSKVQKPVALILSYEDQSKMDYNTESVVNVMESSSQLMTISLSIPKMKSSHANLLSKGLSASRNSSEFSLKVELPIPYDAAALIGNELAAHQTLTKVTLALPGKCGEACFNAFESGLSADTPLTSVGLKFLSPMSDAAIWALVNILSRKSLKYLSLFIDGDMQDSLADALMKALAGPTVLKSLDLHLNGKLNFSGANFLEKGLLENSSLTDLRVFVHGELPGNWQSVVENLRLTKKALVTCYFYPNTWVKVADDQMAHFRPAVDEKGWVPKQHLTVNLWGGLTCEGTDALCEVLVRFPLSSLTLTFHGNLTDEVINCFARCLKQNSALSSLMINIWGELTTEGGSVLQGLSDNNLTVRIKVHDVRVPDESYNACDVAVDDPASLAPLFSKVKDTTKGRLSLTINNQSGAIKDWAHHLGNALAENTSLTALDLTINNSNNMTDCILGDSLAKMSSLTTLILAINNHSKIGFRGKGLSESLIAIKSLSTLSIVISCRNIDEFWSVVLRNCLEQNTSLKKLCLTVDEDEESDNYNYVLKKEAWVYSLNDGLATTTSLNELNLTINNSSLTNHYWLSCIIEGLSKNKSLTTLTVTVNNYQDSRYEYWAGHLRNCLAKNKSLTTLTLTLNDYSEVGQLHGSLFMSDYVTSVNTSLTTLNLTINSCREVTEDWFPGLCDVLMKTSSLTTLRLKVNNHCATSGSRVYDFSKLLPKCRSLSLLDITVSFYGKKN